MAYCGAILIVLVITVLCVCLYIYRNKNVTLYSNFTFKYKMRIQGRQGLADTEEFEAVVKAKSFEEAERKLQKELLTQFKMEVLIMHPVKELR
jgi:hypothetical protein